MQRGDAFHRFGSNRGTMRQVQIVELSAHMRPTGCFLNLSGFVHRVESRVAVGLQRARKIAEMRLRMLALAIRRFSSNERRLRCGSRLTMARSEVSTYSPSGHFQRCPRRAIFLNSPHCVHTSQTGRLLIFRGKTSDICEECFAFRSI
jgi:hypothetical protein